MPAPAGIASGVSGSGRCGIGCCGRCWPRRGCGSARRWGCSTATGIPAAADTPFIEVRPRDHAHGVRVKGGAYRKLYVSDELDRLYGEYLFWLCDAGVDLRSLTSTRRACSSTLPAIRSISRCGRRPSTGWCAGCDAKLAGRVPERFTPHWFRHTHATALLLSGIPAHVVARRLGHTDVQTTLNVYAWVTDDAELRAVADWRAFTAHWRPTVAD